MGDEKTQPTRIDADEYARFKQFVQDVHGTTRGHLKTEIENALREYRQDDGAPEQLTRIENDLATVKALVAEGEGDGGATLPDENDVHTHTPSNTTSGKPPANAPRHEKVEYIAESLYSEDEAEVAPPMVRAEIEREYGFGDRTVSKLVPLVIDDLAEREDVARHPNNDQIVAWGELAEKFEEFGDGESSND